MRKLISIVVLLLLALGAAWFVQREDPPSPVANSAQSESVEDGAREPSELAEPESDKQLGSTVLAEAREAVTVSAEPEVREASASVNIRVVLRGTNEPVVDNDVWIFIGSIPAAEVEQYSAWQARQADTELRTDEDGRVSVNVPASVLLDLYIPSPNDDTGDARVAIAACGEAEQREVLIELSHGLDREFFGQVFGEADGLPIEGARIYYETDRYGQGVLGALDLTTTTDRGGRFRIEARSWTSSHVTLLAEGFGPALAVVDGQHDSEGRALEVRLLVGAQLDVSLTDGAGDPVEGLDVVLVTRVRDLVQPAGSSAGFNDRSCEARSDERGHCRFEELPAQVSIQVMLRKEGDFLPLAVDPLILAPGEVRVLELRVGTGTRVHGRVTDQRGAAVTKQELWLVPGKAGGLITLQRGTPEVAGKALTDENGGYSFDQVAPGNWYIGPAPRDSAFDPVGADEVSPVAMGLELTGDLRELRFDIQTTRGLAIKGRALGPDDLSANEVFVVAWSETLGASGSAYSQADGSFVLGPLIPGRYRLTAYPGESGLSGSVPAWFEAGDEDVVLRLPAGGVVSGRVLGPDGEPVSLLLMLTPAGQTIGRFRRRSGEDGLFEFSGLKPGRYDLIASQLGPSLFGIVTGLEVSAGGTTDGVEVRLAWGGQAVVSSETERYTFYVYSGQSLVALGAAAGGTKATVAVPAEALRMEVFLDRVQVGQAAQQVAIEGEWVVELPLD